MSIYPALAIVVVSYDSAVFLPECLTSLLANASSYPGQVEIALVENGAIARTEKVIQPYLEQGLKWLPAPRNLGYAGGANYGWSQLAGDIFIVLNPDMSFPAGWLEKFIRPFQCDPQIGISGCKLLDREGKVQHAGGLVKHGTLLGEHFGVGEPDDGRWDDCGEVEFVTGAALAVRREVKEATGGFDPAYFPGYYEDVDLCWQARQLGWKVWYEGQAIAYHYEGGTFGRGATYYEAFHRNRLRFARKSLPLESYRAEFLPAERRRLFLTQPGADFNASRKVYRELNKHEDKMTGDTDNPLLERLPGRMAEVKKSWLVEEKPFRSRLPFVALFREKFNNLSTRWYVKPILQQQIDYNAAVSRAIEDLGQATLAQEAGNQLAVATIHDRLDRLEEKLDRVENLLEAILREKKHE